MKMLLIFLFVIFLPTTLSAQNAEPCNLTVKDAPDIHGVRLGMTEQEVQQVLGVILKPNATKEFEQKVGIKNVYFDVQQNKQIVNFVSMDSVGLKMLDNKVISIGTGFNKFGDTFSNSSEAAKFWAEKWNFPNAWKTLAPLEDRSESAISCKRYFCQTQSGTLGIHLKI